MGSQQQQKKKKFEKFLQVCDLFTFKSRAKIWPSSRTIQNRKTEKELQSEKLNLIKRTKLSRKLRKKQLQIEQLVMLAMFYTQKVANLCWLQMLEKNWEKLLKVWMPDKNWKRYEISKKANLMLRKRKKVESLLSQLLKGNSN